MSYKNQKILEQYWDSQKEQLALLEKHILSGNIPDRNITELTEKFQKSEFEVFCSVINAQKNLLAFEQKYISSDSKYIMYEDSLIKKYRVGISQCNDFREDENIIEKSVGKVLIAGKQDEYTRSVIKYFEERNFTAEAVTMPVSDCEKYFSDDICGIVIIGRNISYQEIVSTFVMCKKFGQNINKTVLPFVLFATFMGGKLGIENASGNFSAGSFSGMAKTFSQEFNNAVVKLVDFEENISADRFLYLLDDELHYKNCETGRYRDNRFCISVKKFSENSVSTSLESITPDDVIVVSGGARGVTASCITELSRHIRCKIVLLGRTELPEKNTENDEFSTISDLNGLKKYLTQKWKSEGKSFVLRDVEKKAKEILNIRAVHKTMHDIALNGCEVYYYSCNISDSENMNSVMSRISSEAGKITGIIHGAGIVLDSKIIKKETSGFELVFGTKFKGLFNLVENVDMSELKLVSVFSSIAGLFGNQGQIDYSSGNSFMDKFIWYLACKYPQCRCVSFNWNAWDGGMVDSTYSKVLKSKGIVLIAVETGAKYFVSEILHGSSHQLLISNELKKLSGEQI